MELMDFVCKNFDVRGVVISENDIAVKIVTTDMQFAILPKMQVLFSSMSRKLTTKEEVEITSLANTLERIALLQNQLASLSKFAKEQEEYVATLLFDEKAEAVSPAEIEFININEIGPTLSAAQTAAFRTMVDENMLRINTNGDVLPVDCTMNGTENTPAPSRHHRPMTKREFLGNLEIAAKGMLPRLEIIKEKLH